MKRKYKYIIGITGLILIISAIMLPLIWWSGIHTSALNMIGLFVGFSVSMTVGNVIIHWAER